MHPHPVAPSFATLIASLFFSVGCSQAAGPNLTPPQALEEAQAGKVTLIDVRTPGEWRQTGTAPMAHRIDLDDPDGVTGFIDKVLEDVKGDKAAPIALICRTGNRSGYAQEALRESGFTNVYNVVEGMAGSGRGPGWIRRGLPVKSCSDC